MDFDVKLKVDVDWIEVGLTWYELDGVTKPSMKGKRKKEKKDQRERKKKKKEEEEEDHPNSSNLVKKKKKKKEGSKVAAVALTIGPSMCV